MKIDIAICDDNRITLEDEFNIIKDVLIDNVNDTTIDTFNTPSKLIESNKKYDIVVLDIEMGEMNGIDVAKKLRNINKNCLIFFATNYDTYLDDAFNQHAFRYWTKPLVKHKLIFGLQSAIDELNKQNHYINVVSDGASSRILVQNIIYFYMENKRLHIITRNGEIVTNDTLKNIIEQLKQISDFSESCRGYYINLNYVINYNHNGVICKCDQKIYEVCVSRRKYNSFHKSFIEWIGGK